MTTRDPSRASARPNEIRGSGWRRDRPWPAGVLLCLAVAACGGSAGSSPTGAADDAGSSGPAADAASEAPGAGASGLRPACDLLTPAEVGSAIGKAVGDGVATGTFVCDWSSDPESLGSDATLLAQVLPDAFCEPALMGTTVTGFGRAATWEYSDSVDIPQGSLSACVPGGLLMVTLTGNIGDPSDEAGFRQHAEGLMTLVIGRL